MSRVSIIKIILCCLLMIVNGCVSASSSECLAESDHPYANDFVDTWNVSEPGADQIRIHFENLALGSYDDLFLLDKYDDRLKRYHGTDGKDFWTEWYTGDTLKVKLATDESGTDYGFRIDNIETRTGGQNAEEGIIAESDHPYANIFKNTWSISEPEASQIRLHFENLALGSYDDLYIFDEYDNQLKRYHGTDGKDFWTEWYTGDTLKVKLVTDESGTDYGFRIDYVDIRTDSKEETSGDTQSIADEGKEINIETDTSTESQNIGIDTIAESDHPYANNFIDTWTVSEPGASQIRLHFENLELSSYDHLYILDQYDNRLERYSYTDDSKDFWTEWYTGDILKVKLVTDKSGTDYGFKIDKLETRLNEPNNSSETSGTNTLTATELTSSANPSEFEQSVTLTAKIDTPSQASEEPSGTVTFMDGATIIGTGNVNSGKAILKTSSLSAGSHSIAAEYSGDNYFEPSKSPDLTLTVLEQTDSKEQANPEIEQPITKEHSSTEEDSSAEPSQTNEEPIWENPIISGIIATVVGTLIVAIIRKKPPKDDE